MKNCRLEASDESAVAIAEALPILPGTWRSRRISVNGVKAILILLAVLIGLPSPWALGCACTEVVGGSGAVSSNLSVEDSSGGLVLVQSDIKLPGLIPVELTRTYQSNSNMFGMFGSGWSVNFVNFMQIQLPTDTAVGNGVVERTPGSFSIDFNGKLQTFSVVNGVTTNADQTLMLIPTGSHEVIVKKATTGEKWVFDTDDGTMSQYIDSNGNQVNYTWKVVSKLVDITSSGSGYTPVFQSVFCPLTVTYPGGRQLTFSYDATGDLSYLCRQVTNVDGTTISYSYTDGLLTGVSLGAGQVLSYAYHEILDNYKMDGSNQPDANKPTIDVPKIRGWLTDITYANAAHVHINYNEQFGTSNMLRVTSVTGPNGYSHYYNYAIDPSNDSSVGRIANAYSSSDRAVAQAPVNLNASFTMFMTDSLNHTKSFFYTNNDQNEKVVNGIGASTQTSYNLLNQPVRKVDPLGKVTSYTYDNNNSDPFARRNLLSRTNSLGKVWSYSYDSNYNVVSATDPLGDTVRTAYDVNHKLLTLTNALNQIVASNSYTQQGQLASASDGSNNTTYYAYDNNGMLNKITDPAGKVWANTYDNSGNLISKSDPLNNTSNAEYNGYKKPVKTTDPLGNATDFKYDEMANLISVNDPNGNLTSYTWDQMQRKTSITNALNNTTKFSYDTEANLTTLTDSLGHAYRYVFNEVNQTQLFTFPDNSHERYEYNLAGNLISTINRAGQQTTETYDDAQRLAQKTFVDPVNGDTMFRNNYDDANRLTGVTKTLNGVTQSSVSYFYNAANQTTSSITDGRKISYSYDASQNLSQIIYPSGLIANYNYDCRNKVNSITDSSGNQVVGYTSDDAARVVRQAQANGLETVYTYDALNRVSKIELRQSSNPSIILQSYSYGYDAVGNKLWVQYLDGTGDVYNYDATYQLVGIKYGVTNPSLGYASAAGGVRSVNYAYDSVGNRVSVTDNGNSGTYTVNNLNQYTAISGTNLTYSARGDLAGDGNWSYGYDYAGHLVSASKTGIAIAYKYDTQGRRIEKDINGSPIAKYVYNGQNLIEERDGTGNVVTASYIYNGGIDHPVQVIKAGSSYFFQQDALGNVTALTNSDGVIIEQYSYDAFGKPTIKDANGSVLAVSMTPFLFTGREYDSETGLYHYRSRAYSSILGRFLQPMGTHGSWLSGAAAAVAAVGAVAAAVAFFVPVTAPVAGAIAVVAGVIAAGLALADWLTTPTVPETVTPPTPPAPPADPTPTTDPTPTSDTTPSSDPTSYLDPAVIDLPGEDPCPT